MVTASRYRPHSWLLAALAGICLFTDVVGQLFTDDAVGAEADTELLQAPYQKRLNAHHIMRMFMGKKPTYLPSLPASPLDANRLLRPLRAAATAAIDRRAIPDTIGDFQNCFLSPVQCMLPSMGRR
ncbi:unnamed protein product [Gongylonema pulchrum]|uniref:Tachykinin-3 n=1 Tax=Gongylonema pulchrum TaxID=637853 RepID=A0A183E1C2_9BILA|nr:unnamed protein product [Gongylonema pulchrum]